jgi:UDP-glucose 4-epimerase
VSREGVLLLGGAGFIGSALARRLEQENRTVHILGRHDGDRLEKMLPLCGTVIHLASVTTPGSATHPDLELGNLALTLRLLELMQTQPETHLIFFSSGDTVYGNPDRLPVTETPHPWPCCHHPTGRVRRSKAASASNDIQPLAA